MKPIPAIYNGLIDYRTQDYVFEMRRALRKVGQRGSLRRSTVRRDSPSISRTDRGSGHASTAAMRAPHPSSSPAVLRMLIGIAALASAIFICFAR